MQLSLLAHEYGGNGYYILPGYYTVAHMAAVVLELTQAGMFDYSAANEDNYNLLHQIDSVRQLANASEMLTMVAAAVGAPAVPYHAIILDKTKEQNWRLDWHQDLKIAVKERIDTTGYSQWTEEAGIPHVVPPVAVLEKLLYLRIHLDDCDGRNGAIWVLPQSHKTGIVANAGVDTAVQQYALQECPVAVGGIMLMSPLLLHMSPQSHSSHSRRVLQIAYRATELPNGLQWYY